MEAVAHGDLGGGEGVGRVYQDEGEGRRSADRWREAWLHCTSCTCSCYVSLVYKVQREGTMHP